ncbi:MAG: outer membrane beta-barrel protein [Rhodobacteraceae bacterium]|nr:outer membrane beta-barrel protein [Paracoccaceae bacterium]
MKCLHLAAATCLMASPVVAGNPAPPPPDPVVEIIAPPPIIAPAYDWTGFYAGAQLGWGRLSSDSSDVDVSGDGAIGGLHVGGRYDFGSFVLGLEYAHDWADIDATVFDSPASLNAVQRLMVTGGFDNGGKSLFYLGLGIAEADLTQAGTGYDLDGEVIALGWAYRHSMNTTFGVELLHHEFDGDVIDPGMTVDVDAVQARVSFQF